MTNKRRKRNFILVVVLSGILVVSLWFNFNQVGTKKKVTGKNVVLVKQNISLDSTLKAARSEINRYKGLSRSLDTVIQEADHKISEKEKKINALIASNKMQKGENEKLQAEIKSLRDRYLETIDSLLQVRNKNNVLNKSLHTYEQRINDLSKRLGKAEKIEIGNFTITAKKKSAFGNIMSTALARKADYLTICFDILPNKIAPRGKVRVYIRIFSPGGDVITNNAEGSGIFKHPDYKFNVPYTCSKIVDYERQQVQVCTDWKGTKHYGAGVYLVELHTAKYSLATTTFTLR